MTFRLGRFANQELTRIGIVLSPRRARRGWPVAVMLVASSLAVGAGASWYHWSQEISQAQQASGAVLESQRLQHRLEQERLTLGLAQARSQELERQIDAMNQRLRESQEELAFFRKARGGKP